jgi:ABC-type cobalamin/Fe3+-siderophores transport system ATPase subunit
MRGFELTEIAFIFRLTSFKRIVQMITQVTIHNFKKLENVTFPFSQSVVIIGPNNSGKSTIFQALCLWEIGVTNYIAAYQQKKLNKKNAVTLNKQSLVNSPIANMRFLWKNQKVTSNGNEKKTDVKVEITLEGNTNHKNWVCKAEFIYYNEESFGCKIVSGLPTMIDLYENGNGIHFGFLQPMSGIATLEDKYEQGGIDRRLGEGKTAEVLRNICYNVLYPEKITPQSEVNWKQLVAAIQLMFGVVLQKPEYIKITGIIQLGYLENGIRYDITAGGRGFQQTLLLLAYLYASPNTILLLDEPDAHLEVIRQRQAFQLINELANANNSQIVMASHSEIVLEEGADAAKVIALIENQAIELNTAANSQTLKYIKKALTEIGWEKYYLAKQKKHVLYLEGSTDLQMFLQFANQLQHPVAPLLKVANVDYTSDNVPNTALQRFKALQTFFPELKGLAIFDKIDKNVGDIKPLKIVCLTKRELENYFATPSILLEYAATLRTKYPNFEAQALQKFMQESISLCTMPLYLQNLNDIWWSEAKLSTNWLDLIFVQFYKRLNLPQDFYKRDYYQLIQLLPPKAIDKEIIYNLNLIYELIKE